MNEEKIKLIMSAVRNSNISLPHDLYRELRVSLNKQVPIKRANGWFGPESDCPTCGCVSTSGDYCKNCGQRLVTE